jgi:hypothetical protein
MIYVEFIVGKEKFLCYKYSIMNRKSEFYSNTVVNGITTENIHLVSTSNNGNTIVQGNINKEPVSILLTSRPRTRKYKQVRFQNNPPVSISMDRMPNLFEPVVVYRKPVKVKRNKRKTHKRRSSKRI